MGVVTGFNAFRFHGLDTSLISCWSRARWLTGSSRSVLSQPA